MGNDQLGALLQALGAWHVHCLSFRQKSREGMQQDTGKGWSWRMLKALRAAAVDGWQHRVPCCSTPGCSPPATC